jgi:ribokinase
MAAVIVVGSINRDVFMRVSALPEPGQTVLALETYQGLGGKGANQAVAAARLGAEVSLVGAVGEDAGPDERFTLRELGVDVSDVQSVPGTPTGAAFVLVAGSGENQVVVSPGANAALNVEMLVDSLEVKIRAAGNDPGRGRPVVVAQGELGGDVLDRVVATVRRMDAVLPEPATLVLNLAPVVAVDPVVLGRSDLLVVNQVEGAELASVLGSAPVSANGDALARELARTLDVATLVTLGGAGAVLADPLSAHVVVQPAVRPDVVVDTTGAGDCFVGALAACLGDGRPLREALRWAACAAAVAVGSAGTTPSFPDAGAVASGLPSVPAQQVLAQPTAPS